MFQGIQSPTTPPQQPLPLAQWLTSNLTDYSNALRALALEHNIATPTYGPAVRPDLSLGAIQAITATDGNPFTISAPANAGQTAYWTLVVHNNSGGALGNVTFDPSITQNDFADPGNGNVISAQFRLNPDGTSTQNTPWSGIPFATTLQRNLSTTLPTSLIGIAAQVVTVPISSAQILAFGTTPVQVVAAPGTGKYIVPVAAGFSSTGGGYATGLGARLQMGYGTALNSLFVSVADNNFLTNAGAALYIPTVFISIGVVTTPSNIINQPVMVGGGPYSGGTGTLEVSFAYYVATA